jgi:VanZ family protein
MIRLPRLVPALLYMGLIFYLSSQPAPSIGVSDKILHMAGYGALALAVLFGLAGSMRFWRAWALSLLISSLYGGSDEIHQSFVPSRTADVFDALADAAGSLAALAVAAALAPRRWRALGSEASDPSVKELNRAG